VFKVVATLILAFASTQAYGQAVCLGFAPEANLICNDGGELHKVHAFEEAQCAAGRNGVLNDSVPIQDVDGPIWTDESELAQVNFKMNNQTVTLSNCAEQDI